MLNAVFLLTDTQCLEAKTSLEGDTYVIQFSNWQQAMMTKDEARERYLDGTLFGQNPEAQRQLMMEFNT